MKIAVIVAGPHYSGKSKTINKHVKPILGIGAKSHKFSLRGARGKVLSQSREEATRKSGFVRSQSLEESGRKRSHLRRFVARNGDFELLVFAARPIDEEGSLLRPLILELKRRGYRVFIVRIAPGQPEKFYKRRAREIVRHLRSRAPAV